MKIKITARKYEGDDKYSWAVFRSDRNYPIFTGLSKPEIPHYKRLVQEIIDGQSLVTTNQQMRSLCQSGVRCIEFRHADTPGIIAKLFEAKTLLQALMNDIPSKRDWFDPYLEKRIKNFLKENK